MYRREFACRAGLIVSVAAFALAFLPATAGASGIVTADFASPTLKVNAEGIALVEYIDHTGARKHVLLWGAVNGRPHPSTPPVAQARFLIDYTGGWKSQGNAGYWKTFKSSCGRYDGPVLPFFVAGCKAADGSYWALQSWQRNLPMRGYDPWTERQRAPELHLSHWTGSLPVLEVYRHWTYAAAQQGFFGRLVYEGQPVYGTRSPSAKVADPFARNIYIDVYNSDYGPGWKHDTAITTHPGSGGFCDTFVPRSPPAGYPSSRPRGSGLGERYRVSAMGPGVTPIVQWEGERLGRYDSARNVALTSIFDQILGGDRHCAPER